MNALLMRVLLIAIAGIVASIILTWSAVLLVGLLELLKGVPADPGQLRNALVGVMSLGLAGTLFGVVAGLVATAICIVPTLVLLHFAEKRKYARPVHLISGAIMGSLSGAGIVVASKGANFSSNDLALPVLCGLGGVIAAEIYLRLNRMWQRRRSPQPSAV